MKPTAAATWPKSPELLTHLQLTPWLLLPVEFNAEACLREGMALRDRFVTHRPYSQAGSGQWKSLALRSIDGDPSKTMAPDAYGQSNAEYRMSEIADLCPEIMRFLAQWTDIDQCERIRLMLLEPGAEITVHSDAPEKDCALAWNVAFNMPEGCEFWTDLNPDGSHNSCTRRIPVQAGSIFLFNTATYHCVVNRSTVPRLHLIVHGPMKVDEQRILVTARTQNHAADHRIALRLLVEKRARMRQVIALDSRLYQDLLQVGIRRDILPKGIALGVSVREIADEVLGEEAVQVTMAGLHPMVPEVFPLSLMDAWLKQQVAAGKEFAVVLAAGSYIHSSLDFVVEILALLAKMRGVLIGQILIKADMLPCLHEQFVLLDLRAWRERGCPGFAEGAASIEFPGFVTSGQNAVGDFTPTWIERASTPATVQGLAGWGSAVLAAALADVGRVDNISERLRAIKDYMNPRQGRGEHYQRVQAKIERYLHENANRIYVFNTEELSVANFNLVPDVLLAPCAGVKPFVLLRQFEACRAVFIDHNPHALQFYRQLLACETYRAVLEVQAAALCGIERPPVDPLLYCRRMMADIVEQHFAGDKTEFMRVLRRAAHSAELIHADYHWDHHKVASCIPPTARVLFWHSNAWESAPALYRMSKIDLWRNYQALIERICLRVDKPAYHQKDGYSALIGADFARPQVVLTEGSGQLKVVERTRFADLRPAAPSAQRESVYQSAPVFDRVTD